MDQLKCSALFLLKEDCERTLFAQCCDLGMGFGSLPCGNFSILETRSTVPGKGWGRPISPQFIHVLEWGVDYSSLQLLSITLASSPGTSQCQVNVALQSVFLEDPWMSIRVAKGQSYQAGLRSIVVTTAASQVHWNTELHSAARWYMSPGYHGKLGVPSFARGWELFF